MGSYESLRHCAQIELLDVAVTAYGRHEQVTDPYRMLRRKRTCSLVEGVLFL